MLPLDGIVVTASGEAQRQRACRRRQEEEAQQDTSLCTTPSAHFSRARRYSIACRPWSCICPRCGTEMTTVGHSSCSDPQRDPRAHRGRAAIRRDRRMAQGSSPRSTGATSISSTGRSTSIARSTTARARPQGDQERDGEARAHRARVRYAAEGHARRVRRQCGTLVRLPGEHLHDRRACTFDALASRARIC